MPRLVVEPGLGDDRAPRAVCLVAGDPYLLSRARAFIAACGTLRPVFWLQVVPDGGGADSTLPPVAGRHTLTEDGIRLEPLFPFVAGLSYSATFDPRPLGECGTLGVLKMHFTVPAASDPEAPAVEHVYPSADELPENLLRFYVRFSQPMQRGRAVSEVSLLEADGRPLHDALYRAPVELWDRSMRCLTVLLDPGRLKREVGPNRALGPPLEAGKAYALAIGAGMLAASGKSLPQPMLKRFRATAAVREPLPAKLWELVPPRAGTREPLLMQCESTLDWALLRQAITVTTASGRVVAGCVEVGRLERQAAFTPAEPWCSSQHLVTTAPELEDICGNDFAGAFDRPLGSDASKATAALVIESFQPCHKPDC